MLNCTQATTCDILSYTCYAFRNEMRDFLHHSGQRCKALRQHTRHLMQSRHLQEFCSFPDPTKVKDSTNINEKTSSRCEHMHGWTRPHYKMHQRDAWSRPLNAPTGAESRRPNTPTQLSSPLITMTSSVIRSSWESFRMFEDNSLMLVAKSS